MKLFNYLLGIISGEMIFSIPFMIPRIFRPLMLESWNLNNTQIGQAFFTYGVAAMISYFLGGQFADRFAPKKLISISLFITSLIGLHLVINPSYFGLIISHGLFGISTTLLMWGALIKVTHLAGSEQGRSSAMGILDAGRGLTAAAMVSILTLISAQGNQPQSLETVNLIFYIVISAVFITGLLVWFSSIDKVGAKEENKKDWSLTKAIEILKNTQVWLLSFVVLASYCGYKSVDNYSIYLVDIQQYTKQEASYFTSFVFWLRPISALIFGLAADKFHRKNSRARFYILSLLLLAGALTQILLVFETLQISTLIIVNLIFAAAIAYALRAIYFSVFGDIKIPNHLVGTTVGIVSVIGFLPDMFFGLTTGKLIDQNPGVTGYNYVFIMTASFLFMGALANLKLLRSNK